MSKLNLIYNLAQMKLMATDSKLFDSSHTKDDAVVKAWLNHVIIGKQDGRILIYEFTGSAFKPTNFSRRAASVEDAMELIDKEGKYKLEDIGVPRPVEPKTLFKVGGPVKVDTVIKGVAFEGVYQDPTEPGYLNGACQIAGADFHAKFIRVHDVDGVQEAVNDPHGFFEDVWKLNCDALQTVNVPGFDGDWVLVIYPFAK